MRHPLADARDRLERANEHIKNLDREISQFLASAPVATLFGKDPIITDESRRDYERLNVFINENPVPARFGVLVGEIIHHLRSAFDHIAWQLSSESERRDHPTRIEFPVFADDPASDKNKLASFNRKIKGITSPTALVRINGLQPYKRGNKAKDQPLWIIHEMDIDDKHRTLVIVAWAGYFSSKAVAQRPLLPMKDCTNVPTQFQDIFPKPIVDVKTEITVRVAFPQFGQRQNEPVIPSLQQLFTFTRHLVEAFAKEF